MPGNTTLRRMLGSWAAAALCAAGLLTLWPAPAHAQGAGVSENRPRERDAAPSADTVGVTRDGDRAESRDRPRDEGRPSAERPDRPPPESLRQALEQARAQVRTLQRELERARQRVARLEDELARAGIDGPRAGRDPAARELPVPPRVPPMPPGFGRGMPGGPGMGPAPEANRVQRLEALERQIQALLQEVRRMRENRPDAPPVTPGPSPERN